MPTLIRPISFVATTKPVQCRHFYENKLGLQCLHEDEFALVFNLVASTLRIQKVEHFPNVNHTVLGWQVLDIQATVNELIEEGVCFEEFENLPQDHLRIWNSPSGASVAWFKDPDGNTLSLTQA